MDDALLRVHHRLQTDFPFFAAHAPLMVKNKEGVLLPFRLNRAQRFVHARLEEQLARTGRVRACILKGRQQGCSTYISGRFYHRATRKHGTSVFILSHDSKTTDKLFRMVKRYQDYINPVLRPEEGASNRYQLVFPKLESDYSVGTAGNEQVGRGGTAQLFHGSEAAFWEKSYEIQEGALESIGDVPGTEIILESTANGPVGLFYQKCMDALKGQGDYQLIFVPWFWQDEYERAPRLDGSAEDRRQDLTLSDEERAYADAYLKEFPAEVRLRKILWRRMKLIELATGQNDASGHAKFCRTYPANPVEAFQSSGVGLVRPDAIVAARNNRSLVDDTAPLIAGVDPAGDSDISDRTIIALRRGRVLEDVIKFSRMRPMELAGVLAKLIEEKRVDMCFIDRGYGEGTIDRLVEMGYGRRVQGIAFNERPLNPDIYLNKRSEILIEAAKWINGGGVRIPDDAEIHADLASVPLDEETSNGLKYLKSKREIKKALGRSPDIFDAIGLTFSYPVTRAHVVNSANGGARFRSSGGAALKSMARFGRGRGQGR